MKTVGLIIPMVAVFSFFLFAWRSRQYGTVNFFMAASSGFYGGGLVTAAVVFAMHITTKGSKIGLPGVMKAAGAAFVVAFCGVVLHLIFQRLGELKSTLDAKSKIDLSKVALKILNDDPDYFQAIVVPSKQAKWRDYARSSQIFPRARPSHFRFPSHRK